MTEPLTVTKMGDGSTKFEGGSFDERVDATIAAILENNADAEGLKAILKAFDTGTVQPPRICGQAQIMRILHGEPDMTREG